METMKDYEKELEASFRKINEGDIIKGTVIDVNEEEVTLDLKYYAQGIIKAENLSNDPDFHVTEQIAVGDELEATARAISSCPGKRQTTSLRGISCRSCWSRKKPSR